MFYFHRSLNNARGRLNLYNLCCTPTCHALFLFSMGWTDKTRYFREVGTTWKTSNDMIWYHRNVQTLKMLGRATEHAQETGTERFVKIKSTMCGFLLRLIIGFLISLFGAGESMKLIRLHPPGGLEFREWYKNLKCVNNCSTESEHYNQVVQFLKRV